MSGWTKVEIIGAAYLAVCWFGWAIVHVGTKPHPKKEEK